MSSRSEPLARQHPVGREPAARAAANSPVSGEHDQVEAQLVQLGRRHAAACVPASIMLATRTTSGGGRRPRPRISSTDSGASTKMASTPKVGHGHGPGRRPRRRPPTPGPTAARASVRATTNSSSQARRPGRLRAWPATPARGTTRLPAMCPHFSGHTWSSRKIPAPPADSNSSTVRRWCSGRCRGPVSPSTTTATSGSGPRTPGGPPPPSPPASGSRSRAAPRSVADVA